MDAHCEKIMREFRDAQPSLEKIKEIVDCALSDAIHQNGIYITALESRIKSESSLAGKLELKGQKYHSIFDITDIFGARVITF